MNNIKRLVLLGSLIALSSIFIPQIYAQSSDVSHSELSVVLGFTTFLAAGVYYSTTGCISKIARSLSGENVSIDWDKVGKTTLLGAIIGVGAFVLVSMDEGKTIYVTTVPEFLTQASLNFVAVVSIHKIILAPYKKKSVEVKMEDIHRDDIPEELPPMRST